MTSVPHGWRGKRLFDLLGAAVGLALWLIPLFAIVAGSAVVHRSSGIFRQVRVGLRGEPFLLYKVQTMADGPATISDGVTVESDPRISRLGAWLRRCRLDELPQLINVLKGEMSLVGPRPEVASIANRGIMSRPEIACVRPGLTSPASVIFAREAEWLSREPDPGNAYALSYYPVKTCLNALYAQNCSLAVDVRTLLATLFRRPSWLPQCFRGQDVEDFLRERELVGIPRQDGCGDDVAPSRSDG